MAATLAPAALSPPDFNLPDHYDLSEALLECVLQERDHIAALDLGGMMTWTRRREQLTEQVRALAAIEPAPGDAILLYGRVQDIAAQNLELLQDAHRSVTHMLETLRETSTPIYSARGQKTGSTGEPRGVLIWKG